MVKFRDGEWDRKGEGEWKGKGKGKGGVCMYVIVDSDGDGAGAGVGVDDIYYFQRYKDYFRWVFPSW